jgi:transcriptional regulator of aromatic amino acid metabolism
VRAYAIVTDPEEDKRDRTFERIIGNSAALESVLGQVEQVAPTDSTVIIEGETGTGKKLIAHAIHNASHRCGRITRVKCLICKSLTQCTARNDTIRDECSNHLNYAPTALASGPARLHLGND